MKGLKRHVAIAAICLSTLPASGQAIEFKGVKLGATREEFTTAHPRFDCKPRYMYDPCETYWMLRPKGDWYDDPSYAGEKVESIFVNFKDEKLARVSIDFRSESFERIVLAVTSKYGKPNRMLRSTVETRLGVKRQNDHVMWSKPDGEISISRYGSTIDNGVVLMRSTSTIAADREAEKKKQEEAKKDL